MYSFNPYNNPRRKYNYCLNIIDKHISKDTGFKFFVWGYYTLLPLKPLSLVLQTQRTSLVIKSFRIQWIKEQIRSCGLNKALWVTLDHLTHKKDKQWIWNHTPHRHQKRPVSPPGLIPITTTQWNNTYSSEHAAS